MAPVRSCSVQADSDIHSINYSTLEKGLMHDVRQSCDGTCNFRLVNCEAIDACKLNLLA